MVSETKKFKIGDRVKLVAKPQYGITALDIGTVAEDSTVPYVNWDGGKGRYAFMECELAPAVAKWEPKVGDRVRWLAPFTASMLTKDKVYEIHKAFGATLYVTDDKGNMGHTWDAESIRDHFSLAAPTLTIEAGRYYTTSDGRKVGPATGPDHEGDWWLEDGGYYKPDGAYLGEESNVTFKSHVIAEWVEPAVETAPTGKFKVGDWIRGKYWDEAYEVSDVTADRIWIKSNDYPGTIYDYQRDAFDFVVVTHASTPTTTTTAIVALIEDGVPKPATRPFVHQSEEAATKEAERLAMLHAGSEFGVYTLATSRVADVIEETVKRTILRAA